MRQRGTTTERFCLGDSVRSRFRPEPGGLWVLLTMIGALTLLFSPAISRAAAPGPWITPATTISDQDSSSRNPEIAFRPDGTAIAVWIARDADVDRVQAATRPPGGDWNTTFEFVSDMVGGAAGDPQLAVAPDGAVTAVWRQSDGSVDRIHTATMPSGAEDFGSPVTLFASARSTEQPRIAIGPDGTTAVVWHSFKDYKSNIQGVVREPAGTWGTVEDLTAFADGESSRSPAVTVAPDGAVTVSWAYDVGYDNDIQSRTRPPHGTFGSPETIASGFWSNRGAQLVTAPDGTTTIVWEYNDGSQYRVYAASRPASGAFGPAEMISGSDPATWPLLAVARDGAVTVAWIGGTQPDNQSVRVAHRPAGHASFEAAVTLSGRIDDGPPQRRYSVAVAPDGTVTVVWSRRDLPGMNRFIQVASRPPGAGEVFGPVTDLTGPINSKEYPVIAYTPDETGIGTAAWGYWNGSNYAIQSVMTRKPDLALNVVRSGTGQGEVASAPVGIDCGIVCAANFPAYTEVTLAATAGEGSSFTGWSGEGCTGTGSCRVRMDRARHVAAGFALLPDPPRPVRPTRTTAVFDGERLHILAGCAPKYKPGCITVFTAVTGKGRKGKPMAKPVRKKIKAGKWIRVTFPIKAKYRTRVRAMSKSKGKQLLIQQKLRSKKIGGKQSTGRKLRVTWHRYRVIPSG